MIRTGIFIGAAFWLQLSSAWASPGHDAVGELGALNGVALDRLVDEECGMGIRQTRRKGA